MENQELAWLVKSGGRILGPFTKEDVIQLLQSREIVVLDEISHSHQRWSYIRDHAAFAKVVEDLRQAQFKDHSEDTFTDSMGGSLTESITEALDSEVSDELTDDLDGFVQSEEIVYDNVKDIEDSKNFKVNQGVFSGAPGAEGSASRRQGRPAPAYAMSGDKRVRREVQKKSQWLRMAVIGGLVVALSFVLINNFLVRPMIDHTEAKDDFLNAKKKIYVGEVAEGYEILRSASQRDPENEELKFYLGVLEIQEGGQTVRGRELLRSVLGHSELGYMAHTAMGLSELKDGELDRAEDSLHQALLLKPDYYSATLNLGVIALYRQDYSTAIQYFSSVAETFPDVAVAHMLLAMTHFEAGQNQSSQDHYRLALKGLGDLLASSSEYRQEAELLRGYIYLLLGESERAEAQVEAILSVDPFLIEEFRPNLLLHRDVMSWTKVRDWCEDFVQGVLQSARVMALRALCLAKIGRRIDARRAIDSAVNQSPRDTIVQSIFAYVLWQMGMMDQAGVALANAMEQNRSGNEVLPLVLQARFCYRNGDIECAIRFWQQVLQMDPKSVLALGQLAKIHFEKREFTTSQNFLIRGFSLSDNYKPLYQVRQWSLDQGLLPVQ